MRTYPLRSPFGGAPVYYRDTTGSTMTDARALVADGAPSGTVVFTDFQRAGRGRLPGRRWVSAPGESLMFTLALSAAAPPAAMPLRAGAAIASALESGAGAPAGAVTRISTHIKWPNDVLVGGRKISGVLCEYSAPWLYVGMGVNLHQTGFPGELAATATSVFLQTGLRWNRDALLCAILERLAGSGEWCEFVNARLWRRGERAAVTRPDGTRVEGVLREVAADGTLVLELPGGAARIVAGEISADERSASDSRRPS